MSGTDGVGALFHALYGLCSGVPQGPVLRQPTVSGMNFGVHPKYKTKYRVTNWTEYDQALVERGDIAL